MKETRRFGTEALDEQEGERRWYWWWMEGDGDRF